MAHGSRRLIGRGGGKPASLTQWCGGYGQGLATVALWLPAHLHSTSHSCKAHIKSPLHADFLMDPSVELKSLERKYKGHVARSSPCRPAVKPAGVRKLRQTPTTPTRRSPRLHRRDGTDTGGAVHNSTQVSGRHSHPTGHPPSPSPSTPPPASSLPVHCTESAQSRKRKRASAEPTSDPSRIPWPDEPLRKRHRSIKTQAASPPSPLEDRARDAETLTPIAYWNNYGCWPKYLFSPKEETMSYSLAQKKSASSLRRSNSQSSASEHTASDQRPREEKCAPYRDPRYPTLLAAKGSFMDEDELGPHTNSRTTCRHLLENEQSTPNESIFRDDLFKETCRRLQDRNEARVIRDISCLLVPSAETFAIYGATHLKCLIDNVNEGWNNSIPLTGIRPQPDYSVGFRLSAFTAEQRHKIEPLVGGLNDRSYFMATYQCYFPFLACEVKCGAVALDVADRQNAHSMTLAVRGIVALYRAVRREKEIDREILAFSFSHDHRTVRMYGHYAVLDGKDTSYYRYPIRTFDFTEQDGREKWASYKFTKNMYDLWMPKHLERIRSAIDDLPENINFDVSTQTDPQHTSGSFSQAPSETSSFARSFGEGDSMAGSQDVTPTTSFTQDAEPSFKKPRKRRAGGE